MLSNMDAVRPRKVYYVEERPAPRSTVSPWVRQECVGTTCPLRGKRGLSTPLSAWDAQ
jgi:hypothetical protein